MNPENEFLALAGFWFVLIVVLTIREYGRGRWWK